MRRLRYLVRTNKDPLSIVITASPAEKSRPAVRAIWWPKLREKDATRTRASRAAIPFRASRVRSALPLSTRTSSKSYAGSPSSTRHSSA